MKKMKMILFAATALALYDPSAATAEVRYTYASSHDVKMNPYAYNISPTTYTRLKQYLDYEHREPCQHYQDPPAGFIEDGCDIYMPMQVQQTQYIPPARTVTETYVAPAPVVVPAQPAVMPIDMELHFAFNSAHLDTDATSLIYQAAQKIREYKPSTVMLHGHADRSGPEAYNVGLSQRRADAVSNALQLNGISPSIIQTRAHGETDPKVPTADGVRLRENRRVVIDFMN